jgi:hypothetical protein
MSSIHLYTGKDGYGKVIIWALDFYNQQYPSNET